MGMFDYLKSEYPADSRRELLGRHCLLACQLRSKLQRERRERFLATWLGRRVFAARAWGLHSLGMLVQQSRHVFRNLSERASRSFHSRVE